ncbi:MAG: hypothetical protein BACD_00808 [Bacteroides rodentium]
MITALRANLAVIWQKKNDEKINEEYSKALTEEKGE